MKTKNSDKRYTLNDPADHISCALCGEEDIYSGIEFKGHFVCEDCVEYVSSGRMTDDGIVVFPDDADNTDNADGTDHTSQKNDTDA